MKLTDFDRAQVRAIESEYWSYDGPGLMYAVRKLLSVIDRLSQEPEVVQSEWINIQPCTNDVVEYADFIAYLARTEQAGAR